MTKIRLFRRAIICILVAGILFVSMYALISNVRTWKFELNTERQEALSSLNEIESRQAAAMGMVAQRPIEYLQRRKEALQAISVLLDTHAPGEIKLSSFKPLMDWTALCVTNDSLKKLVGDDIPTTQTGFSDAWAVLASSLEEAGDCVSTPIADGNGNYTELFACRLTNGGYLLGTIDATACYGSAGSDMSNVLAMGAYPISENGFFLFVGNYGGSFDRYAVSSSGVTYPRADVEEWLDQVGDEGLFTLHGERYYVITKKLDSGEMYAAFLPLRDLYERTGKSSALYAAFFTAISMLLFCCVQFLKEDEKHGLLISKTEKTVLGERTHPVLLKRLTHFLLAAMALTVLVTYGTGLFMTAFSTRTGDIRRLNALEQSVEKESAGTEEKLAEYNQELVKLANVISQVLKTDSSLCTNEGITRICDRAGLDSIYILDARGKTVATSTVYTDFELETDATSRFYAFWNVIRGYDPYCILEPGSDNASGYRTELYVGVARRDAQGLVQIGIVPDEYRNSLGTPLLDKVKAMPALSKEAFYFAVDPEGCVRGWPDTRYADKSSDRLGLTETEMKDGFAGFSWLADQEYFLVCRKIGEYYVLVATPKHALYEGSLSETLMMVLCGLCVSLLAYLVGYAVAARRKRFRKEQTVTAPADRNAPTGKIMLELEKFRIMRADEKLSRIFRFLATAGVIALLGYYQLFDSQSESSALRFILSEKWNRSLNVFSVAYVLWIMASVMVVARILCMLVRWLVGTLSSRIRTVGILLCNLAQYISVIGALFYCLPRIGFDTTAVVATASFISFALTFGAQELIKDFLCGLFIIFEDTVRVGDWIRVAGVEGYVEEIGLRVTTIVVKGGVSNIIHNSAINNFMRQVPLANVRVQLQDPSEVDKYRQVLKGGLHTIRVSIPELLADPYLERAEEANGVILVHAQCRKEELTQAEYELTVLVRKALTESGLTGWTVDNEKDGSPDSGNNGIQ